MTDTDNLPPYEPPRVQYPKGTPEYAAYERELHIELAKFVACEPPYDHPVFQ